MTRQSQIPGKGSIMNESGVRQAQIPGSVVMNEKANAYTMAPSSGTFSISGSSSITLLKGKILSPSVGTFSITGNSTTMAINYPIAPTSGSLSIAGQSISALIARSIAPTSGTYTITGYAINSPEAHILTPDAGQYNLTGYAVALGSGFATTMQNTTLRPQNPFIGYLSFYDYYPAGAKDSTADITTQVQNFLLYCQRMALSLKNSSLDNLIQRSWVKAKLPRRNYYVSCPIIVPELVDLDMDGYFVRVGSSGTITNFYTGDTTTKALANLIMPTVIIVPRGHSSNCNILCNSNGTDRGSGRVVGKTWVINTTATVTQKGSGYIVGDILTAANPSKPYYTPAQYRVTSVDGGGGITGITCTVGGNYALPPVLQLKQWTTANGFPGIIDSHGNLSVSGGTGSFASIAPTWISDWGTTGSGNTYYTGAGGIVTDTHLGRSSIQQSQRLLDPTYGGTFIDQYSNLNHHMNEQSSESGEYALLMHFLSDTVIDIARPVNMGVALQMYHCTSVYVKHIVCDTPLSDAPVIGFDGCSTVEVRGSIFKRVVQNSPVLGPVAISIGQFNAAGVYNNGVKVEMLLRGAGVGGWGSFIIGHCPAVMVQYSSNYDVNLQITNREPTWVGQYPRVAYFAQFGPFVGPGRLRGNIDGAYGTLFVGTIPQAADIDVWDGEVCLHPATETITIGGTGTSGHHINLIFTNIQMASFFGWPHTVSITCTGSQTPTSMALALANAINADISIYSAGIQAVASGASITIYEMGQDANATTLTYTVTGTGSITETVAFGAGGVLSGAISGGKVGGMGLYDLKTNGVPINGIGGTGWNKAPVGSTAKDYTTGIVYRNTGTLNSPTWTNP